MAQGPDGGKIGSAGAQQLRQLGNVGGNALPPLTLRQPFRAQLDVHMGIFEAEKMAALGLLMLGAFIGLGDLLWVIPNYKLG